MDLRKKIAFVASLGLLVGLVFSPFLLSLAMWALAYAGLVQVEKGRPRLAVTEAFRRLWAEPSLAAMTLIFWTAAASGLWSSDLGVWLERTQVRLPFFVLPLAFAGLDFGQEPFSKRQFKALLTFFVALMTAAAAGVLIHFLMNSESILIEMRRGGAIPVPRNHIRFSLLIAQAVAVGWRLFELKIWWKWARIEQFLILGATVFLFLFLHILAVRSGLAAMYAAIVFGLFRLIFVQKRWILGISAIAGLVVLPFLALRFVPSLEAKKDYASWDWSMGGGSKTAGHSDTDRLVSLEAGLLIFSENRAIGVGIGDLPDAMREAVKRLDPTNEKAVKLPHNQFIYVLAAMGAIGLGLHILAWSMPFFDRKRRPLEPLFWVFEIILFVSFLVEYTIEGTFGATMAAFFPLFFWRRKG